jgi:hypothetical protein
MKVIYFILELSFIISELVQNWLENGQKLYIDLLEYSYYDFFAKLEINQRINVFISFDSEKYKFPDEYLTFYEYKDNETTIRKEIVPFTKFKEGNITTLVAVYIAYELKTDFIGFGIAPSKNIRDVTILAKINKFDIPKEIVETFLNEGKIINFKEFSSKYLYKFTLTADYNSYAKLELIFDTKDYNYKNFYLSHIFEYQYY